IAGNRNIGLLGVQLPLRGKARFALARNRIAGNRIDGSRLAIALAGADSSHADCVQPNPGATTEPASLGAFSCAHATTLGLPVASSDRVLMLVARLPAQLASHAHRDQPPPPPQPTMPQPCRGAPPSPLCPR